MQTQLVVLGGGPGGYAAAFLAADLGMEVTIVEQDERLGGTCLLRGCIPSKALLHVARVIGEVQELRHDWGVTHADPQIDINKLRERKEKLIGTMSTALAGLCKRRNVRRIKARGVLENATTLRLEGDSPELAADPLLGFQHLIIATGSTPAIPPTMQLNSPRVMDSTGALALADIPQTLLVIGGGYIGLEMATVYANLGSKVSVVELTDGLLQGCDRDLAAPLAKRLKVLLEDRIFLNTKVGSVGLRGEKVEVAFEGPGKYGVEQYDRVLISVGRRPNSRNLGLEKTGVQVDPRGFIVTDNQRRTAEPTIYAIGDVAGDPMLAHKASHEGRMAVEAIMGHPVEFNPAAIPAVVFTDPEIAWTGLTEDQCKKSGRKYTAALYPWGASGKSQAMGRSEGLTKWIIDPDTERVLGCGIVGPNAGDLISEATLAIEMRAEVGDIAHTIHPHPTLSETLMFAGEVFYGTATEIYKPKRKRPAEEANSPPTEASQAAEATKAE